VKTISLKKVAVVAVASLGFGLLSVVPAQAAVAPVALYVDSSSGSDFTDGTGTLTVDASGGASEDLIAGTSTAFAAADVGKAIYTDAGAYICTIGSVASATSANCLDNVASDVGTVGSAAVAYKLGNASTAGVRTANPILASTQISGLTVTAGKKVNLVVKSTSGNQADASKIRVAVDNVGTIATSLDPTAAALTNAVNFTAPSVAGTYTLTITYSTDGTDFTNFTEPNAAKISFTLTVTADSAFSADVSTVYMNDNGAETNANTTAATTALGATGVSTVDTLGAVIWFNAKKANGTTYSGGTFYAYMTGPGKLDIDGTTYIRSESIANTGQHYVKVAGDGTTGVGTVVMYMILADGVTRVNLPSRTVSFYGSVAKLEATVVQGIATAGVANGACGGLTDCTYATLAEKPAVLIKATDANGVLVPGLTITGTTADGTVIASSAVSEGTGGTDYNGAGYYNASVTGGSITGKSANVTYSTTLSTGVVISSNAVSIANAGTPRTVTWALDKTSYEPGAQILITVTAKDANGNAAADGTYANLFAGATTASGSITGSTPAASVELVGGKKEYKAFAPGTGGSYTITNTTSTSTGASAGTVLTGTVVVTNPNAALLTQIDALNAKIVALNALIAKIMKKLGVK